MAKDTPAADPVPAAPEAPPAPPVPTYAKVGVTPEAARLKVVDADTGKAIAKVVEANTQEGWLVRFDVKAGNLIRERDDFKTVREERPIRFEWLDA